MATPVLLTPEVVSSGVGALGSIGSTFLNGAFNRSAMKDQISASKELMDYQWKNFQSPLAQVNALAAAGINPAVALGQGGSGFTATPSVALPTSVPPQIGGINDIAQFVKAMADAKKADVDIKNIEVETEAKQFELELSRVWSNPEKIVNLTQAWKNVMLSNDEHSLNEWKIASEKALSGLKGIERDTAKKLLDNMDIQISQENKQREESIKLTQEKQKTEKTSQSANVASARASNTQADINIELKKIHSVEREVLEVGKVDRINSYLAELREKNMLSDEHYQELRQRIRAIKNRQDYADSHDWYGDFLNTMDDLSFYLSKFNPLNMVKPSEIAPSK